MDPIKRRYCNCIMHVANQYPRYNPYAVCTKSVYGSAGKTRKGIVRCADQYRFEDFSTEELRGYAQMKKKIPNFKSLTREELIRTLYKYVASEKGREVWQVFLSRYRKDHPEFTFSQAIKMASKEYKSGKNSL